MREWRYKTDEKGRPRRFYDHRELGLWAALKIGRYAGPLLPLIVVLLIFDPQGFGRGITLSILVLLVLMGLVVVAAIHLYVALSGGIMSAEERSEHLRKLRESRRGRW